MEFGLNEDQKLIDQSLRSFLADTMPLAEIRRVAESRSGFDDKLWTGLSALGLPGLLVDEAHGGAGLGMMDAAVVVEAMGYGAAPMPFIGACVMAPLAIALAGSDDQRNTWLPGIASGDIRMAVVCGSLTGATGRSSLALAGDRLSGEITGLLDSGGANHALVFLDDGGAAIVALDGAGVTLNPRPSLDRTRPLADLSFHNASANILGTDRAMADQVLDAGRVILAADTSGAGHRMIEKAVEYAGQRVQFDRVIASYQAVKHMCAEMTTSLEPCRSLVWYAAHIQDGDDQTERRLHACLAKANLAEVGREVACTATEVHGGMGFTDLMGLHYWLKRIGFDRQVLGGPEHCRREAAKIQGWLAA